MEKYRDTDTQRKNRVMMEAETWCVSKTREAKDRQGSQQKLGKGKKGSSSRAFRQCWPCRQLDSDFQPPELLENKLQLF